MKIKVVSPSAERAEQMAQIVRASGPGLEVGCATSPLSGLSGVLNGSRPVLLVLDGVDLPALDTIDRLSQSDPDVQTIVISAEQSPAFLVKAMRSGVREVLSPTDANALQAAVQRAARKHRLTAAPRQGEVLAFMGCKGGSGASVLAANLAHILSVRDDRSVALLDLDLQFGDALLMLSDQQATSDVAEVARSIGRLDIELLRSAMVQVSDTLSVLSAPRELSQALEVTAAHVAAIIQLARQNFDFVLLDVGRTIDALTLQALDLSSRILPVVQLSLPQLRDAKRLSTLFRSLDYPPQKIHWLVNRYQKGGDITLESLRLTLGASAIATIPNHYVGVSASVNQGVPIDRLSHNNPVARALAELAQSIAPAESGKKDTWFGSLFGGLAAAQGRTA